MAHIDFSVNGKHMKDWKSDLVFCALAGVDVIGMNLYLYGIRHKSGYKWLVVDFGIGFSLDKQPGAQFKTVGIEFLEDIKKDIIALVITHAHEDHSGALAYTEIFGDIPIYATDFTKALLQEKCKDYALKKIVIQPIKDQEIIKLDGMSITAYEVPHSVPQTISLLIKAKGKTILHTSDFCFEKSDGHYVGMEAYVQKILQDPLDVLMCDSTGVLTRNKQIDEETVYQNIISVITKAKKRVFVTCFSSNIQRFLSVYAAAKACNRPFYVLGQSIKRSITAASSLALWPHGEVQDFLKIPEEKDNAVILISGCQGEGNSTLTRLAFNNIPDVIIKPDDVVIYSARAIPGNALSISRVQNAIADKDAHVLGSEDLPIHAGGHANREQLEKFLQLLQPRLLIPMHGERRHIKEMVKLAKTIKIEAFAPSTGQVIGWSKGDNGTPLCEDVIPAKAYVYDSGTFIKDNDECFKSRVKTSFTGHITLFAIKNSDSIDIVKLFLRGISKSIINAEELEERIMFFWQDVDNETFYDIQRLEKATLSFIKKTMKKICSKRIPCDVVISDISLYK